MQKPAAKEVVVPMVVALAYGLPARRSIMAGVKLEAQRWRTDPWENARLVGISTLGQLLFWTLGQDFLGVYMEGKLKPGLGHWIARQIQPLLPDSAKMAWTLKCIEIALDSSKAPIEGALYRQIGIIPDAWAALMTQPLGSLIEAGEKTSGVILHPERVTRLESVEDSISSIYGTLTRHVLSYFMWRYRYKLLRLKPRQVAAIVAVTLGVGANSYRRSRRLKR